MLPLLTRYSAAGLRKHSYEYGAESARVNLITADGLRLSRFVPWPPALLVNPARGGSNDYDLDVQATP